MFPGPWKSVPVGSYFSGGSTTRQKYFYTGSNPPTVTTSGVSVGGQWDQDATAQSSGVFWWFTSAMPTFDLENVFPSFINGVEFDPLSIGYEWEESVVLPRTGYEILTPDSILSFQLARSLASGIGIPAIPEVFGYLSVTAASTPLPATEYGTGSIIYTLSLPEKAAGASGGPGSVIIDLKPLVIPYRFFTDSSTIALFSNNSWQLSPPPGLSSRLAANTFMSGSQIAQNLYGPITSRFRWIYAEPPILTPPFLRQRQRDEIRQRQVQSKQRSIRQRTYL